MSLETDPIDWKRDPVTGDLVFPLRYTTGLEAVVQGVRMRLALIRGEFFADLDNGTPYFEREGVEPGEAILGKPFSEPKIRAAIRERILSTPNVESIVSLVVTFEPSTRTASVAWQARTRFGDTDPDTLELL